MEPLICDVLRGGIVESVHTADLAVVDDSGTLIASAGDALTVCAFRSSAKPIQAGVCLEAGWIPASSEQLAIACASHNGEPEHVRLVEAILAGARLSADALRCPPATPNPAVTSALAAASGREERRFHNCSGKHAAFLATCVERGWPLETYLDPGHPLQQAIHEAIEHLAGALLESAVDGCGSVTFGAPLAAWARAFGAATRQEPYRRAAEAMRAHPFLVAGSTRLDTAVMEAIDGVTVKGGAEGLVCAAGDGWALAAKCRDGGARAAGPFLFEGMRRLNVLPDPFPETLVTYREPDVTGGGRTVGKLMIRP